VTRLREVRGAGGVRLALRETGPEEAPAILLIHGWSQASLAWEKQFAGKLAERYRLGAPDLRGHGASDKPNDPAAYDNPAPWAADVAALIAQLDLGAPLLVGWSMGGWVCGDYLGAHGDAGIAGLALVGSSPRTGRCADPAIAGKRRAEVRAEGMYSDDIAVSLPATIAFVKACVSAPMSKRDLALWVGFNALCPPGVRKAARLRDNDYRETLAALTKPALLIQGTDEKVCLREAFEEARAVLPAPRVEMAPGCGHAPFWEDAARFDAALGAFAADVFGGRP
jgi:pimeloyl-ACP methyl ester carboxylesterase